MLQRLVKICGEVKAGPAENEEIHFLCTVCSKITADPYLVNFFLDVSLSDLSPSRCTSVSFNHKDVIYIKYFYSYIQ